MLPTWIPIWARSACSIAGADGELCSSIDPALLIDCLGSASSVHQPVMRAAEGDEIRGMIRPTFRHFMHMVQMYIAPRRTEPSIRQAMLTSPLVSEIYKMLNLRRQRPPSGTQREA